MIVSASLLPDVSRSSDEVDIAIVIDVLRATSVMATALAAGAAQIVTCREIEQARALAAERAPKALLCGERACKKIDGFDLGNSPAEYVASRVVGQSLVLTTTNGTRAIESVANISRVFTASFLNIKAVVNAVAQAKSLHLVCAGTDGKVTAEDVLLAGAIINRCETRYDTRLDGDDALIARQLWRSWFPANESVDPGRLSDRFKETQGGKNLLGVGYQRDLALCAKVDSIAIVPQRSSVDPAIFQCKQ